MNETEQTKPLLRARAFPWFAYCLVALVGAAGLAAGLFLVLRMPEDEIARTVTHIRIMARPGIDLSKIEEVLDTPDYYIEAFTAQGGQRTETFKDTRVGSGLTFQLPIVLRLPDITEIRLCNRNMIKDEMVDRIDRPARVASGERFQFELLGADPPCPTHAVGLGLAICGGAVLLIAMLRFLWYQVI